jgi:hypothetical protein
LTDTDLVEVPINFGFCYARDEAGLHRRHHKPADAIYNSYPALSCVYCGRWLVRVVAEGETCAEVQQKVQDLTPSQV